MAAYAKSTKKQLGLLDHRDGDGDAVHMRERGSRGM